MLTELKCYHWKTIKIGYVDNIDIKRFDWLELGLYIKDTWRTPFKV